MRTTSESPRSRPAARAGAEARRAPERFTRAGCAADARRVDADARTGSATAADAVVKADIVSIYVALCALGCVVRPRIDQSRVSHKKRMDRRRGQRRANVLMRPRRAVRAWRVSRWRRVFLTFISPQAPNRPGHNGRSGCCTHAVPVRAATSAPRCTADTAVAEGAAGADVPRMYGSGQAPPPPRHPPRRILRSQRRERPGAKARTTRGPTLRRSNRRRLRLRARP